MNENKTSPLRARLTAIVFILLVGGLSMVNLLNRPAEFSRNERRRLAVMPQLTAESLSSGDFMSDFESYSLDSFIGRDTFRTIKALSSRYLFWQTDNGGIYFAGGHVNKLTKLNEGEARKVAAQLARLVSQLPDGAQVYYSLLPDKGLYLPGPHPQPDYDALDAIFSKTLPNAAPIHLRDVLNAGDYYTTDLHWDQAKLGGVLGALGQIMDFSPADNFLEEDLGRFRGVYAGQSALPLAGDTLTVLTGASDITVRYLNTNTAQWEEGDMYWSDRVGSMDPYDTFLGGPQPLIVLENPNAATERELIFFRDSFGSSLAPLLAESYRKITLVDLRYISSRLLDRYVTVDEDTDVLLMYSLQIVNNSTLLMVQ